MTLINWNLINLSLKYITCVQKILSQQLNIVKLGAKYSIGWKVAVNFWKGDLHRRKYAKKLI